MIYRISGLAKVYDTRTVLDIPTMNIEKGRIHALLGPNGAGKTTLLNILGFLDMPTSGEIIYESKPVRFNKPHMQILRRTVSLVDQQPILFTTSVAKNLEFGLNIRRIPKKDRLQIIDEALDLVGMRHFSHVPANQLSGGETQRIAIARALAVLPGVLLCDEPTSSVDVENQGTILNILKKINEEKGITIIFTTHDRLQAALLSETILFLDNGRLTASGNENYFSATLTRSENQQVCCEVQNTIKLMLPSNQTGIKAGKARIMLDPDRLLLYDIEKKDKDDNFFKGRILQVSDEREKIRVVVNIGIRISVAMSPEVYHELHPFVGENMVVNIPPESVRVLQWDA